MQSLKNDSSLFYFPFCYKCIAYLGVWNMQKMQRVKIWQTTIHYPPTQQWECGRCTTLEPTEDGSGVSGGGAWIGERTRKGGGKDPVWGRLPLSLVLREARGRQTGWKPTPGTLFYPILCIRTSSCSVFLGEQMQCLLLNSSEEAHSLFCFSNLRSNVFPGWKPAHADRLRSTGNCVCDPKDGAFCVILCLKNLKY